MTHAPPETKFDKKTQTNQDSENHTISPDSGWFLSGSGAVPFPAQQWPLFVNNNSPSSPSFFSSSSFIYFLISLFQNPTLMLSSNSRTPSPNLMPCPLGFQIPLPVSLDGLVSCASTAPYPVSISPAWGSPERSTSTPCLRFVGLEQSVS